MKRNIKYIEAWFEDGNKVYHLRFKNIRKLEVYCDMQTIQPFYIYTGYRRNNAKNQKTIRT